MLEKILQEIEKRAEMVKNIQTSYEEGVDFPDGEQCYEDGRLQGRFEELLWVKKLIRSHMEDDGWIPCSERLPEDGTYMCTLDGELCGIDEPFTGMCGIENGVWDEPDCVLAWKPLPEPYRPKEEN